MASGPAGKMAEAKKFEADGAKCAKKSFFHKPDWEGAAQNFERAANLYKNAKSHEDAKRVFQLAADAQYHLDAAFSAGQNMEKAAIEAEALQDTAEAGQLYQRASQLFLEAGTGDKAAAMLSKAAKTVGAVDPDQAIELMMSALETYETDDRERFSGEAYKATISLLVKNRRYGDAVKCLERQLNIYRKLEQREMMFKNFLSIVVLYLQIGDYVAADRANTKQMSEDGYVATNESRAANELLDAYDAGDQEAMTNVTKKQVFNFLDQDIARLAKKLTARGEGGRGIEEFRDGGEGAPEEDPDNIL